MADDSQRFCPYCGQSFLSGEAVLQCSGCSVMHHPACWVRNGGCSTAEPHEQGIVASSFGAAAQQDQPAQAAPVPPEDPGPEPRWARPGAAQPERSVSPSDAAPAAAAFGVPVEPDDDEEIYAPPSGPPAQQWAPPPRQEGRYTPAQGTFDEYDAEAVVDEAEGEDYEDEWDDSDEDEYDYDEDDELERRYSEAAGAAAAAGATARRAPAPPAGSRYVPPGPDRLPSNRPIARARRDGGGGRYFLIPVIVAVLGIIGVGVVLLYNALSDDDDNILPVGTGTATEEPGTATQEPVETPTEDETEATPTATQAAVTSTPTLEPGTFAPGQTVVVSGVTDCLNVRSSPDASGTANILACAPEGSEMTIVAQGELVDGTQWWEVDYEGTQGFSAGEFLAPAE